jgi:hypothetical protein
MKRELPSFIHGLLLQSRNGLFGCGICKESSGDCCEARALNFSGELFGMV